eukprot:5948057-Amphidinium_carterae.2
MTSLTGGSTRDKTNGHRDLHKDCRKEEDVHKKDAEEACDELEKAQMGVHVPELDSELGIDMSNEKMLKYLKLMNEHFCRKSMRTLGWSAVPTPRTTRRRKTSAMTCKKTSKRRFALASLNSRPLALQRQQVHPHQ